MTETKIDSGVLAGISVYIKEHCNETFAQALREERKPIMRQEDLASWLDYTDTTISRWETDTDKDSLARLPPDERYLPYSIEVVYRIVDALTQNNRSLAEKENMKIRLLDAYFCDSMKKELVKLGFKEFWV